MSAGIDGDDAFEAFVRGSWSLRPLAHSEKNNDTIAASERGREIAVGAGRAGRTPPRTAPAWYGNNGTICNIIPDKTAQTSSRTVGVPLYARTGGTAPGRHHSIPRENNTGGKPAVGSPCVTSVVHQANYFSPVVSRMGELWRSTSMPPGAGQPGRKTHHTGATNDGSARKREGSPSRPVTAARRDADNTYGERSSARVGATTLQAKERMGVEDAHRRGRPATQRARWAPGDKQSGDGGGSRKYREERVPQRQTQHEQGQGHQAEELKGYRVEQQRAGTAGLGVTAIPAAAADLNVRQHNQPPVDITTARVNNSQHDFESNTRAAHNTERRGVPSTTNNVYRARKSDALIHGRGYHDGGIPVDRSAAAVRVQRVFRGHRGRKCAGAEGRKRARQRTSEREANMERARPHAASRRLSGRLPRPKLPSTYGF